MKMLIVLLLSVSTSIFAVKVDQEQTPAEQCAHNWDENLMVTMVEGSLPLKIEIDDNGNLYGSTTDPVTGYRNDYICGCVNGELLCD